MQKRTLEGLFPALARIDFRTAAFFAFLIAFCLFLIALVLTGHVWRAVAYGVVALFAFLVLLAAYFWGSMLFGGALDALMHRRTTVPWEIGTDMDVPEHNIDPGLELIAAGILVYRMGEVRPHAYFRKVPLANVRAVRPFMVARTGAERTYQFLFTLNDENETKRYGDEFAFRLSDMPQVVMPPVRLLLNRPRRLVGQRWSLQVRSGVTVVTTFRFIFVEGSATPTNGMAGSVNIDPRDTANTLEWKQTLLPQLLDEAVKRDAMTNTQEIELEVV
ncbi:MAG: hypothetical protein K8S97_17065 [Anaerolineae bacterium]|nr:hypothetical protein [Anaerolineae bacterium]